MTNWTTILVPMSILAGLAGCNEIEHTVINEGALCFFPGECQDEETPFSSWMNTMDEQGEDTASFDADQPMCVQVTYYSEHKPNEIESECWITIQEDTIVIRSKFEFTTDGGWELASSSSTEHGMHAICQSPPIPAGNYTVVFGEKEKEFVVPNSYSSSSICSTD